MKKASSAVRLCKTINRGVLRYTPQIQMIIICLIGEKSMLLGARDPGRKSLKMGSFSFRGHLHRLLDKPNEKCKVL